MTNRMRMALSMTRTELIIYGRILNRWVKPLKMA